MSTVLRNLSSRIDLDLRNIRTDIQEAIETFQLEVDPGFPFNSEDDEQLALAVGQATAHLQAANERLVDAAGQLREAVMIIKNATLERYRNED